MLLYMPATCTGELRKLALPNRGPYLIKEIGSSGATIQECKPCSKPILVAINHTPRVFKWKTVSHHQEDRILQDLKPDEQKPKKPRWRYLKRGRLDFDHASVI